MRIVWPSVQGKLPGGVSTHEKVQSASLIKHFNGEKKGASTKIDDTRPVQNFSRAVHLGLVRGDFGGQLWTYFIQPRGLDDEKNYKVSFDNTGTTKVFSGADLLQDGITISVEPERRSELLLFEAE